MRISFVRTLVLAATVALAGHGAANDAQAAVDIDGDWHFRIGGSGGAALLRFPGTPNLGQFEVNGAGYSAAFDTAFKVSDDAVQQLQFASNGNINGAIALDEVGGEGSQIGTLTITSGRLNRGNTKVLLKGTIQMGEQPARRIAMLGERLLAPTTQPTGLTFDGGVQGAGVHSSKFQIQLMDERLSGNVGVTPPLGQGHPFYYLYSGGPVRIDGVETPAVTVQGLLITDPRGRLFGRVGSNSLGGAALLGKVRVASDETDTDKTFRAMMRTDEGRRVWVAGSLD